MAYPYKNCLICHTTYRRHNKFSKKQWQDSRFCSRQCFSKSTKTRIRRICLNCNNQFSWKDSPSRIKSLRGKYCSLQCYFNNKKGQKSNSSTKFIKGDLRITGKNNFNWKGGVISINEKIRKSFEYEEWRKAVIERDFYTCQHCKKAGNYLEVDHIKPFSLFPELRLEISNGRTLCHSCHMKTYSYMNKYMKREDFL